MQMHELPSSTNYILQSDLPPHIIKTYCWLVLLYCTLINELFYWKQRCVRIEYVKHLFKIYGNSLVDAYLESIFLPLRFS